MKELNLAASSHTLTSCLPPPSPCRAANSSWRTTLSSSLTSSGTKLSTPLRKTAGGCCATWFATSSPQMSSSSPVVWAKGSVQSTQEIQAWRDDRSTLLKSAASEVRRRETSVEHLVLCFSLLDWNLNTGRTHRVHEYLAGISVSQSKILLTVNCKDGDDVCQRCYISFVQKIFKNIISL